MSRNGAARRNVVKGRVRALGPDYVLGICLDDRRRGARIPHELVHYKDQKEDA